MVEDEDLALFDRQPAQGPVEGQRVGTRRRVHLPIVGRLDDAAHPAHRDLAHAAPASCAIRLPGGVDRNPLQPGVEPLRLADLADLPPGGDERVLGGVARVGLVAEDRVGQAVDGIHAGTHELLERGEVALAGSVDERQVGRGSDPTPSSGDAFEHLMPVEAVRFMRDTAPMVEPTGETARVRSIWDRMAATYARGGRVEGWLLGDSRRWVGSHAVGDTLEIGVGTGRNLAHYGRDVRLTGIDISPAMLAFARRSAGDRVVELRLGDAQALDVDDGSIDTVVSTLTLCSIPDDRRAIGEAFRVLRPGGRFVLVEHVRSDLGPIRAIERAFDARSVRVSGDHLLRDPMDHLEDTGFEVEEQTRLRLGVIERVLARKPPDPA